MNILAIQPNSNLKIVTTGGLLYVLEPSCDMHLVIVVQNDISPRIYKFIEY